MQAVCTIVLLMLLAAAKGHRPVTPCDHGTNAACHGALSQQQHATCTISVHGDGNPRGGIKKASINCTGGTVSVTVHQQLLGKFKEKFSGVTWYKQASAAAAARVCLLTLHEDTKVLIVNSSILDVGGLETTNLQHILCVLNTSRVELRSSNIVGNWAQAIWVKDRAVVTVNTSHIQGNTGGHHGMGVSCSDAAMVCITGGSRVADNISVKRAGGGVVASDHAKVTITGRSKVSENASFNASCGGILIAGHAMLVLDGMSSVVNNTSFGYDGGGVCAQEFSSLCVHGGSQVSHNVARNASAGGIEAVDDAFVEIDGGSMLEHNRALNGTGGGMVFSGQAKAIVRGGSRIMHNVAANASGGGILTAGNSSLVVEGASIVAHNTAAPRHPRHGGGGLQAQEFSFVEIRGESVVADNTVFNGSGGGVMVLGDAVVRITDKSGVVRNRAYKQPGGGVGVMDNATVIITGSSIIANNTAYGAGGIYSQVRAIVVLANGSIIANNSPDGSVGGGVAAWGSSTLNITNGVQFSANLPSDVGFASNIFTEGVTALHMDASILDQMGPLSRCHNTVYRELDFCGVGDYKAARSCECCPASSYSFEPNITFEGCRPCPAFATCPGADNVLPLAGYWHSSPMSVQMHACPLAAACVVGEKCQSVYQGNLCGSCAAGYGMTLPFRCAECMSPRRQLGLYILLSCLTVVFIAVTVYFTWRDNVEGSSNLRPSDLIKVAVIFLQYLVILGSITAPWPRLLKDMFAASTVVFAAASGQALTLDCWLKHFVHSSAVPLAIQRQLVNFVAPVAVTFCVILLQLVWHSMLCCVRRMHMLPPRHTTRRTSGGVWQSPWRVMLRQMPVVCIVVAFYAYPTLVKTALSFFACVRIDDVSLGPYAAFAVRNHTQGYWLYDVEQQCFAGWHRAWAFGLGLPAVVVLCAGVPVVLWAFLHANRARSGDPVFREHYGFLYRNYTDDKVWWEAVWAIQTVLLTTVSVFHHAIKAYYSVLLLNIMFLGVALLQALAEPCVHNRLHRMQLAASACLYLTAFATLSLFSVYGYEVDARVVPNLIAVVLLVGNCVFLLWCLFNILACTAVGHRLLTALWQSFPCSCSHWTWSMQHTMLVLSKAFTGYGKNLQGPSVAGGQAIGSGPNQC